MDDLDVVKAVALLSGLLAIIDRLYGYGKAVYIKNPENLGMYRASYHIVSVKSSGYGGCVL